MVAKAKRTSNLGVVTEDPSIYSDFVGGLVVALWFLSELFPFLCFLLFGSFRLVVCCCLFCWTLALRLYHEVVFETESKDCIVVCCFACFHMVATLSVILRARHTIKSLRDQENLLGS